MEQAIETEEYKGHYIHVVIDEEPESPREWSTLGKMACFHGRYDLGDKHDFESRSALATFMEKQGKNIITIPLYLYDHSGITMSTTPFNCPWDSGQVGYIYITKADVIKEYGGYNKKTREQARNALIAEVSAYDEYIMGRVYGYVIEKEEELVDSLWGIYGLPSEVIDRAKEFIDGIE